MHPIVRAIALAAAIALAGGAAFAQSAAASPIDSLAWLAGCWAGERGERRFEEQWMAPRGGLMLGMSRTVKGKDELADFEQLQIRDEQGVLVFTARPSRQPQVSFRVTAADADGIVFENPLHDFPQRISYRRQSDGSLLARIEGELRGQARAAEFPMRRVACPAG